VKLTETEELDLEHLESLLTPRTKLVALPHMSNTLGFVTDVGRVVDLAGRVGAKVLLDACQSVPNRPVDVKALGVDFLVASGHKMCGPTGIGFLWSRLSTLERMPPWMGGGEMIEDVFLERSTYAPPPLRFEAGTPAIAEAIGLEAACEFLSGLGMDRVQAHEEELAGLMHDKLSAISGLRIYGPPPSAGRAALAAFNVQGVHPTDISSVMDSMGVALRSGHMCTQPLHRTLGVSASVRASAYVYNTPQEVDAMVEALKEALAFLRA
ncbi:class-V aminotransferase, partial [Helicosporidium sp. ATCC 50920]